MNVRCQFLFLALLIARLAGAEPIASPGSLPSPTPSPVWPPPTPGPAPEASAAALASPTPERETAVQTDSKLASQQDREPAASAQAAATPSPSTTPADLISTLATRQDQPVMLSIDEAAGVEMTREWRDRAKDFESQNMTDGAVEFRWPAEIPSIVCAVLQVTDVALEPGEAITSVSTGDNLRWSVEAVVSGEGPAQQPHLIIKPFDRGLMTSVVVTTTRRSYHLTLRSTDQQYMHEVSFTYPGEPKQPAPTPEQKPKVNVALTEEVDPPTPAPTPEKKLAQKTSGQLPRWKVRRDPPGRPQVIQDPEV